MKQRGRSPKPSTSRDPASLNVSLKTGGSSSKSLTTDLYHDGRPDEVSPGGDVPLVRDDSTLVVPSSSLPNRSLSQTMSPCHSRTGSRHEFFFDEVTGNSESAGSDGSQVSLQLTQKAIDQIQQKISRTKELIRDEQTSRDNNVNEYLKLSANAERQQQNRIKQVFEKKNQKSAQSILQLQKKLEEYQRKIRELESHGLQYRPSQKIRGIGQGIKDGLTGMSSTVMSKPKELAAQLLKHRSGSFDNLTAADSTVDNSVDKNSSKQQFGNSSSKEDNSFNCDNNDQHRRERCLSYDGSAHQVVIGHISGLGSESDESVPAISGFGGLTTSAGLSQHQLPQQPVTAANSPRLPDPEWKAVVQELSLLKEEVGRLNEELGDVKQHFKHDLETLRYQLRDQRDHCDRLEDQIRDMIELHQHEILTIKTGVTDMEEKVQYQSEERVLDIREHLQSLENKLTAVEHQAAQQQYLNIEGLDTGDARALLMKLLTAVITVVHIMLFFVGTCFSIARPFVRTTARVVTTALCVSLSIVIYYKQEAIEALITKLRNKQLSASEDEKS